MTFEEIDEIIMQGKELGIYMYIYTGGEPLVRKKDLIAEDFAEEMLRVKNFIPAISVEGFESATDGRRGNGTYQKVVKAMEILKKWGAKFVWYFHYMPVGNDAVPELLPNPQQREFMYHRIRKIRSAKPIFAMDFQNDGEYVGGCIAGGRRYLHINANGDVDPCVFIHYSDSNIREKTLLECLQSPVFKAYHDGQPFHENHLRPCPMLENPQLLRKIVHGTTVGRQAEMNIGG